MSTLNLDQVYKLVNFLVDQGLSPEDIERLNDPVLAKQLVDLIHGGNANGTTIWTRAAEIMGDHFINIGVAKRLDLKVSDAQVAKYATVPFSEAELAGAVAQGLYLVAMPEVNLLNLRQACPSRFWDQDWYKGEAFAKVKSRPGYHLLGELPGSTSKTWEEQVAMAMQPTGFEPSRAAEMSYLAAAQLPDEAFPNWVRTADVDSDGDRVIVEVDDSQVRVNGDLDSNRNSRLAVASGQFRHLVS